MSSREIRARIDQDTQSAHRLGFDDPPAFVAAGVPLSGMQSAELLRDVLTGRSRGELLAP
jgi:predicted DsbA family dithiol-disulfide isomerase